MKILQKYLLIQIVRNLLLSLLVFTLLFLIFDFFDHIDNLLADGAGVIDGMKYFLYKIPLTITLMTPVATLVSTIFTIGILSKNSEITAMRASGLTVMWIARPLVLVGLVVSLLSIVLNETLVPYATRRGKEVYNIDIRQKDKRGSYSQNDFWWRNGNSFFSADQFDSRTNTLINLSRFDIADENFSISRRTDAERTTWVDPILKWSMRNVTEYRFSGEKGPVVTLRPEMPLTINDQPESFYDMKTDPDTMSFRELRRFIKRQASNGIDVVHHYADLYGKLAFPFVNFIVTIVVLPFALKPARTGSLAVSFLAGLAIGFSYFAVHSFSVALGRAEIWHPLMAAWMANILFLTIGAVLHLGAESPN